MKKFLSLVLALIMTMSLVTISASAAEYKDFTDKDEIQYEEAVAVLNRLGIITGYSEGDFRPEGELTRGAAAKIIVSLLIGPDAANNVSPTSAPYKDVPLDHTFAGVIAYCKTAGIISGYSDGSFQPGGTLTGYAFSKMLLGALGFKSDIEHFTGAGWNMNVNARAAEAGLFDRLNFKGNDPVNREEAAQLALNTLKATMVEYSGGFTVNAGDASVVGGQNRSYKTSNNRDYALNISSRSVEDGWWTVEFGEEHFVDLRLEHDKFNPTPNSMGDPSAEWSYKKVTIGTYPLDPDFSYDNQVSHLEDTAAAKKRALGLSGYEVDSKTTVWLNGFESGVKLAGVEDIADYTDNGTRVRVYVSETQSDYITDVVVEKTQLMEVKRLGSDYVSMQMYDNGTSDDKGTDKFNGYNQSAINKNVENVQAEDDYYTFLSGLKTGDVVAVVPVSVDHGNNKYEVFKAYAPETVSGTLNSVQTYGKVVGSDPDAINITVGDTAYNIALWNKDLHDVDGDKIKVTRKDVTLYLDEMGNAMLAKDIGATNDWMIVGNYRQSLENGRLTTIVNGWDISGAELSLNLGPNFTDADKTTYRPGDLVKYSSSTNSNVADWTIDGTGVYNVYAGADYTKDSTGNTKYEIKASNVFVALRDYDNSTKLSDTTLNKNIDSTNIAKTREYFDKSVKFIYVTFDIDGEVESIEVKNGAQNVSNDELLTVWDNSTRPQSSTKMNYIKTGNVTVGATGKNGVAYNGFDMAQACVKRNDKELAKSSVKAVVIKNESNSAISSNMLYIRDYIAGATKRTEDGKIVFGYTVAMMTANGMDDNVTIYSTKELKRGDFASYVAVENAEFTPFYDLRIHNDQVNRTTATFRASVNGVVNAARSLVSLDSASYKSIRGDVVLTAPEISKTLNDTLGVGNGANVVSLANAQWVDLSGNDIEINSVDDLEDALKNGDVAVRLIVNDNPTNDGFRQVAMIVIDNATIGSSNSGADQQVNWEVELNRNGYPVVEFNVTRPSWAADDAVGTLNADLYVNGVKSTWAADPSAETLSGASDSVSGRGQLDADRVGDVEVRNISVTWTKANVVGHADNASDVVISRSAAVGTGSTINVKISNAATNSGTITVSQSGRTDQTFVLNAIDARTSAGQNITANVVAGAAVTVKVVQSEAVVTNAVSFTSDDWTAAPVANTAAGATVTLNLTAKTAGLTAYTTGTVAAANYTLTSSPAALNNVVVSVTANGTDAVAAADPTYTALTVTDQNFTDGGAKWTAVVASAGHGTGVDAKYAGKVYTKTGDTYTEVTTAPTTDQSGSPVTYYHVTANEVEAAAATPATMTISFTMPYEAVNITAFEYPKA